MVHLRVLILAMLLPASASAAGSDERGTVTPPSAASLRAKAPRPESVAAAADRQASGTARATAADLEWAREFGATHTVNARNTDPVEAVRNLTGGNGANVTIEAVGNPVTFEQAFYARDHAGTVVLVGVPSPDMKIELPMIEIFGRGGAVRSSWYGDCLPTRDFPMFIELYLQGRLDLDRFVSETISIGEVEEAFHKMERGEVLRSVVVF